MNHTISSSLCCHIKKSNFLNRIRNLQIGFDTNAQGGGNHWGITDLKMLWSSSAARVLFAYSKEDRVSDTNIVHMTTLCIHSSLAPLEKK